MILDPRLLEEDVPDGFLVPDIRSLNLVGRFFQVALAYQKMPLISFPDDWAGWFSLPG